jgi:hypothetical protein
MNRKVFNKLFNLVARYRLEELLPEMRGELISYSKGSNTTGTQPITLYLAVRDILKYRPKNILECGTGASTVVLALAVRKLKNDDPTYDGKIISMESVEEWYNVAVRNLPDKFHDIVTIVHGPRKKYEISMFRGYIHSNIPEDNYDFVFLDGPSFEDDFGTAFCADAISVSEMKQDGILRGVVDGRASSAFVMQLIYGSKSVRYYMSFLASSFKIEVGGIRKSFNSTDMSANIVGKLRLPK